MHFTRGKPLINRVAARLGREAKYRLAAPLISPVIRYTGWLDGDAAPPRALNYAADGDFVAQGDALVAAIGRDIDLFDGIRILDIGCGIGRLATGFHRRGRPVTYRGFDIVAYGIEWCRKRMPEADGFAFTHADIYNRFYNPNGRIEAEAYRFPHDDAAFDLQVAISVFTHLLEPATRAYLREAARVMAPGGVAYFTTFLVPDRVPPAAHFAFDHRIGAAFVERVEEPEMAVGYTLDFWEAMAAECGLRIDRINRGSWTGEADLPDYQDCLFFRRTGG